MKNNTLEEIKKMIEQSESFKKNNPEIIIVDYPENINWNILEKDNAKGLDSKKAMEYIKKLMNSKTDSNSEVSSLFLPFSDILEETNLLP